MGVSLSKGGNVSLSRVDPNLNRVVVGLGWDARSTSGAAFDLDASVFMLGASGKVPSDEHFIFYNQLVSPCRSVEHSGDNRTGAGDGDDEAVKVDLARVPSTIQRLAFAVTIHDADARRQNFGQVAGASIRVVNEENDVELVRFDLSEDYSTETAMVFGEVYRHNGEWKFRAVGQGFAGGLEALCGNFGVNVG
jgi:tellurium resistance protein TerD